MEPFPTTPHQCGSCFFLFQIKSQNQAEESVSVRPQAVSGAVCPQQGWEGAPGARAGPPRGAAAEIMH